MQIFSSLTFILQTTNIYVKLQERVRNHANCLYKLMFQFTKAKQNVKNFQNSRYNATGETISKSHSSKYVTQIMHKKKQYKQ